MKQLTMIYLLLPTHVTYYTLREKRDHDHLTIIFSFLINYRLFTFHLYVDFLSSNNLRDKCIYFAERRERGAWDYEREAFIA